MLLVPGLCRQVIPNPFDFHFVFIRIKPSANQTETQVHQIGIYRIGFTIIADFLQFTSMECLPDLAAVHTQFTRETAQFRHIVQRHVCPRLIKCEQIHQIAVALVITADIVVPLEIAAVSKFTFAHIPITRGTDAVQQ